MTKRIKQIRSIVDTILDQEKVAKPPIKVHEIALGQKINIREEDLGEISGLIFREGNQVIIGVNKSHSDNRKRFTIAHELGHFFLHSENPLYVDKVFAVKLRDHVSSEAIDKDEIEANAFAGELLMPSKFLKEDFSNGKPGVLDYENKDIEDIIEKLAKRYEVSTQAMTVRLIKLGVIQDIF
jgi:Zn-dependent peptidase ImmA (M78 family)